MLSAFGGGESVFTRSPACLSLDAIAFGPLVHALSWFVGVQRSLLLASRAFSPQGFSKSSGDAPPRRSAAEAATSPSASSWRKSFKRDVLALCLPPLPHHNAFRALQSLVCALVDAASSHILALKLSGYVGATVASPLQHVQLPLRLLRLVPVADGGVVSRPGALLPVAESPLAAGCVDDCIHALSQTLAAALSGSVALSPDGQRAAASCMQAVLSTMTQPGTTRSVFAGAVLNPSSDAAVGVRALAAFGGVLGAAVL